MCIVTYCVIKEGLDLEILRISHYLELPNIAQKQQHRFLQLKPQPEAQGAQEAWVLPFLCASPVWLLTKPHTAETCLIVHHFCFLGQRLNSDQQKKNAGALQYFQDSHLCQSVTKGTNLQEP